MTITPVRALHEVDHRYDITGYILGTDQQPIEGVSVAAHLDGERMGGGRSDSDGYYRFRIHLHDSDLGRELRLKTPDYEGRVRVTLTPGDASTARIHYVNFIGGALVEGELAGRGGISTTLVVVGVLSVSLLGSFAAARHYRRLRRRKVRMEQKVQNKQGRSVSRKRKKRRR